MEEKDEKFDELFDNYKESVKLTGHVYGWSFLFLSTSTIAYYDMDCMLDGENPIMYGLMGATAVGVCTFEVSKIIDSLKERRIYNKKFNEVFEEIMNEKPKVRRR